MEDLEVRIDTQEKVELYVIGTRLVLLTLLGVERGTNALVTDSSQVMDFGPPVVEGMDSTEIREAIEKMRLILEDLREKSGDPYIDCESYIWEVAEAWERKLQGQVM